MALKVTLKQKKSKFPLHMKGKVIIQSIKFEIDGKTFQAKRV